MLIVSTGCAGVEERNQVYRIEVKKVLQKQSSLAKEEHVTLLALRQKPCNDQISTPKPDRNLMSTKNAVCVHHCEQCKIMRSFNRNVYWSKNNDRGTAHSLE